MNSETDQQVRSWIDDIEMVSAALKHRDELELARDLDEVVAEMRDTVQEGDQ